MNTKYKVIAKNGVRVNGKRLPEGTEISAEELPSGSNIEVAIRLKQIAKVGETAAVAEPTKAEKKK